MPRKAVPTAHPSPTFDDLARLRSIAEEGRRVPLASGRYLMLWGYTIFAGIAVQAAITLGWLPLPPVTIAYTWIIAMLGAGAFANTPAFKKGLVTDRASLGTRIERTVWTIGGIFVILAQLGIAAAVYLEVRTSGTHQLFALLMGMPALTFGVYAIALATSAQVAAHDLLRRFAFVSLAFVPITLLLAGSLWQFAAVALGIVLVSIVPGHIMLAAERARVGG